MGVKQVREVLRPVWAERTARWKRSPTVWIATGLAAMLAAALLITNGTALGASESADWFAAFASVFAVGIALHIATRDRRDRQQEAAKASEAQARLVRVTTTWTQGADFVSVDVNNYGQWAVIDVTLEKVTLHTGNEWFTLTGPGRRLRPDVVPPKQGTIPGLGLTVKGFTSIRGVQWNPSQTAAYEPQFDAEIEFSDANGERWRSSSQHGPWAAPLRASVPRPPLRERFVSRVRGGGVILKLLFKPTT